MNSSFYEFIEVVIPSGCSKTERMRQVQALGAGAYIKKPYLLQELGEALKTELSKSGGLPLSAHEWRLSYSY